MVPMTLRLYVAGEAPNSLRAVANLRAICQEYLSEGRCRFEIVDVNDEPQRFLEDGVLVTPTLLIHCPSFQRKIIGDLSQRQQVLDVLGWGAAGAEA